MGSELDELTYKIRGAIFSVYNNLGTGLFESVYHAALVYELIQNGLKVCSQVAVPVIYKDIQLDLGFRLDILINDLVIIEIKSLEAILNVHKKQLLTYLRLAKKPVGYLVNFNADSLIDKQTLIRIVNFR